MIEWKNDPDVGLRSGEVLRIEDGSLKWASIQYQDSQAFQFTAAGQTISFPKDWDALQDEIKQLRKDLELLKSVFVDHTHSASKNNLSYPYVYQPLIDNKFTFWNKKATDEVIE